MIPWGTFPQVRIGYEWIRPSHDWACEVIKPEHADRRRGGVELYDGSPYDYNVQFRGRVREAAHFVYYNLPLELFLQRCREFKADQFDLPILPGLIEVDAKGSDHGARTALMPYSFGRWQAGLFHSGKFTHLSMCRADLRDPYVFEMCGWCTKEEFLHQVRFAPDQEYPQTLINWTAGTPFVPISMLHPARTLAPHRLPLTRKWVREVSAGGLWATERAWADMKKRRVV